MNNFISLQFFSSQQLQDILSLAKAIKAEPLKYSQSLEGKYIGLLFEKPSLRTKTAFYIGALGLGAQAIYYTSQEIKLGQREKVSDAARTLASYLDAVVLRTFSHDVLLEFTQFSSIPVVNALSNLLHPSQALADILTISELKPDIKKLKIVYLGDGNNVCHSLIYCLSILGCHLTISTPDDFKPSAEVLERAGGFNRVSGGSISVCPDPVLAAKDADVLYTDVWTSMGDEDKREERKKAFKNFQINDKIVSQAKEDSIVMHCLPAHRAEEITDSVIDGKHSVVFHQAENRLHSAKAILYHLLGEK
tara:strand:- start:3781 stop:4698 length:918 start_codon:yes stop_codon:yes gene_type:complete